MELRNLFNRSRKKQTQITLNNLGAYLSALSDEEKQKLAGVLLVNQTATIVEGDGHATFLDPMTDDEYAKWMHEQEHGWKKVYDFLLGRTKSIAEELSKNENGDS